LILIENLGISKMRRNFWMKVGDKMDERRLKRMKNVDDN